MEDLREELIKLKEYTLEMIKAIRDDSIHLIPILIAKRQEIIDKLQIVDANEDMLRSIGVELQLSKLEHELQESYIAKKDEIYSLLQDNKNTMAANNAYLNSVRGSMNILNKII